MLKKIIRKILKYPALLVGYVICICPLTRQFLHDLLSTWYIKRERKGISKLLYEAVTSAWIDFVYLKERDPDKREELKKVCMGKASGACWASYYNHTLDLTTKVGSLTLREANPIYHSLENQLKQIKIHRGVVIQVGSSSGSELAYFAKLFPQIVFVGTDICEDIIEYSKKNHNYCNLSFVVCPAQKIKMLLDEHKDCDNLIIISSGSLQYVQPEHLLPFFNDLNKYCNLHIILCEPGSDLKLKISEYNGSVWRGSFSYSHNYNYYAIKAGLKVVESRQIYPYLPEEAFPQHKGTFHYYLHAKYHQISEE